jgi:hypothetical protein
VTCHFPLRVNQFTRLDFADPDVVGFVADHTGGQLVRQALLVQSSFVVVEPDSMYSVRPVDEVRTVPSDVELVPTVAFEPASAVPAPSAAVAITSSVANLFTSNLPVGMGTCW